jgi:hypothetical protein
MLDLELNGCRGGALWSAAAVLDWMRCLLRRMTAAAPLHVVVTFVMLQHGVTDSSVLAACRDCI